MSSDTGSVEVKSEDELEVVPQDSKPVLRPRVKQPCNSDLAGFSSDLSDLSDAESPTTTPKPSQPRGSGQLKIVPYDPVVIPFGERVVETLLSYRYEAGKEEFLVKFKYTSHHHVEWLDRETIERETPAGKMRVKKFLEQFALNPSQFEEPFLPTFLEVDRVLDEGELESSANATEVYLLVKWCGLPYDCSTWEKISKVKELAKEKVEEFYGNQVIPDNIPVSAPIPTGKAFEKLETSPEFKGGNTLRDYQLEGLNWFTFCWQNQRSCIMADEMGLGKTVQSVSFLNHLQRSFQVRGPFIIVAPLSTLPHWEREFRSWTELNVIVYHGSATSRNLIVDTEFYFKDIDGNRTSPHYKFHVLITTYEMILVGSSHLKPIGWRVAIFDEAHRLKNKNSKMLETLKTYKLEHRVLLTGTPLQNSVAELFSLLNFLNPAQFSDEDQFLAQFGDLKSLEGVKDLQDLLKPLMLRRFKEDVEKSLPDKEETVVEVELTGLQKTWYRAILERNFAWIRRTKGASHGPSLNNIMMEIRKCCNHPFLIKGAEEDVLKDCDQRDFEVGNEAYLQALISSSGKLVLLDKLLPKLKEGGHKVLIFSQMARMLDILGTYLFYRGYPTERIDGSVKSQDRQAAIDRFSTSPDSFTFLLCTRAGGVGINLTAADTVVIFDSDWNPQNDLQAQARVHRIGQTKPVKIYRLLCANTYEREMFDRANLKLGLDKAVMQKMEGAHNDASLSDSTLSLSKKEIEDLLKLGAYGALLDDSASSQFFDEDIDQILERRSTVVRYDANQKGTAFSKASFTVRDGDSTDLNDPEFWDKWAKRANVKPEYIDPPNPLIIDEPRIRKRPLPFQDSNLSRDLTINDDDVLSSSDSEEERVRVWSPTERIRLERNLTIYGVSNWDRFEAAMPRRSLKDIQACVIQFFQFIGKGIGSDLTKSFTQVTKAFYDQNQEFGEWEKVQSQAGFPYPGATPRQTSEFRSFLDATTQDYCDRIIRKAKNLLKRIYSLHLIKEMVGLEVDKFVVPVITDPFPVSWWSTQADRDLIIGTKKHGFLQLQAFQDDPDLIFSSLNFGAEPHESDHKRPSPSLRDNPDHTAIPPESNHHVSWPSNSDLKLRINAILGQVERSDTPPVPKSKPLQSRAQNYLDDQIAALRNGTNLDYDIEMDPTWSNKEHKNFSRLLTSFGLETATPELGDWRWSRFRILSSLNNKSDAALNVYLAQFITLYHQVLFDPSGDNVREKNPDVAEFLTRLKAAVPDPTTDFNIEVPSPEKAKRLIKRVMLMHAVRHEVLPAVPPTGRMTAGFPDWWRPCHEAPFVEAVTIYGFSREDLITKDKSLPFTNIDPRDWVKETPTVKHLETLVELVKNPSKINRRTNINDATSDSPYGIISFQNGRSPSPRDQYNEPQSSRHVTNGRRFTQMVVYDSPQGPILVKDPHFVPRDSDNRHSIKYDPEPWPSPGRKSRSRLSPPYRDSHRDRSRSPQIHRESRSHYFESPSPY